jgi:hypothetical protein
VIATPQVLLLYRFTGIVRLEGKSAINYAIGSRMLAGEERYQADYALDSDLHPIGVWMVPNSSILRERHTHLKENVRFVAFATYHNLPRFFGEISSAWIGAPFLPALALLGALRRPWDKLPIASYLFVAVVPLTSVVATFTVVHGVFSRNYFIFLPFLTIWAASGLTSIPEWVRSLVSLSPTGFRRLGFAAAMAFLVGLSFLALVNTAHRVRKDSGLDEESMSSQNIKNAGTWIGQHAPKHARIMDLGTPVAFHAGADYIHFPYASASETIRFLDAAKVDYVVLREGSVFTEYYAEWLRRGIPEPRAKLVYTSPSSPAILVFQWTR